MFATLYRVFFAVAFFCTLGLSLAQAKDSDKIFFVDLEKVGTEAQISKTLQAEIEKRHKVILDAIEKKKSELTTKAKDIESKRQKSIGTKEEKNEESKFKKDIEALQSNMQSLEGKFQDQISELENMKRLATQRIIRDVKRSAEKIGKKHDASIIMFSNIILYEKDGDNDITEEIIKDLDSSAKPIDLDLLVD